MWIDNPRFNDALALCSCIMCKILFEVYLTNDKVHQFVCRRNEKEKKMPTEGFDIYFSKDVFYQDNKVQKKSVFRSILTG